MYKNINLELILTKLVIVFSVGLTGFWTSQVIASAESLEYLAVHLFFIGTMASGYFVYLITRYGYLKRLSTHRPENMETLLEFAQKAPSITILIPSYKEEIRVIRQSILSTAFQLYPNKRVVLLIDDPPSDNPVEARRLPQEIQTLMQEPQKWIKSAEATHSSLQSLHQKLAFWFTTQAENYPIHDHSDQTFVELTFTKRALFHQKQSRQSSYHLEDELQFLKALFEVDISSFERKQFENLSHAPNKAMNLNSYISLMGKGWKQVGNQLVEGDEFHVPHTDFIAMLDADSVLSFDYALRLIHQMSLPEMKKVAVIQTPYRAFPGAKSLLERIAGATTDMQFIAHQGFTYFGATFWVGANAIVRKEALDHIVEIGQERGYEIKRYIQDKTVIEDTESSIDLRSKGWSLYNYPERMSYSATPPDFGSLLIQRRRWANGGLLILPKLIKLLWKEKRLFTFESLLRFHYLGSLGGTLLALGLIFVAPFSFDEIGLISLFSPWPYLLLFRRDLVANGYSYADFYRVLALNTSLLPVNLAGVMKSIEQAITGEQIPFCRTPKIQDSTLVPGFYQLAEWSMAVWAAVICIAGSLFYPFTYVLPSFVFLAAIAYALPVFVSPIDLLLFAEKSLAKKS